MGATVSAYRSAFEADTGERLDVVEGLLDSTAGTGKDWTPTESVRAVLDELAQVCRIKAVHVQESHGRSDPDAKAWLRAATKLEGASMRWLK